MMVKKLGVLLAMSALLFSASESAQLPHRMKSDEHMKTVLYDPNNVVILKLRYGYETQIVFSPFETIQTVATGDSKALLPNPVGNNLFIKPLLSTKTDMTVLTNMNSYTFQVDSRHLDVSPVYKLQIIYPHAALPSAQPIQKLNKNRLNWEYSFTGNPSLIPIHAFDNGTFTFFKFRQNGLSILPAIFSVNDHREEALVNYHREGDFIVIHQVAKQFTLRHGKDVASVYNDLAIGDWQRIKG